MCADAAKALEALDKHRPLLSWDFIRNHLKPALAAGNSSLQDGTLGKVLKAFSSFVFFFFPFFLFSYTLIHLLSILFLISEIKHRSGVRDFVFKLELKKKEKKSFVAWQAFCLLREGVKEISRKLSGLPAMRTQLQGGSWAPPPTVPHC